MNKDITDTKLHLLQGGHFASDKEFEILGVSILAYLEAIPGLFSKKDLLLGTPPTIQGYGLLYGNPEKSFNNWIGKAFEYAVVELFNSRSEPYYSLICGGIDSALSAEMGVKVNKVSFDIERSSCIRVAWESADAEDLIDAFGRFRTLEDARRSIGGAAKKYPGLKYKVDVIFCDKEAEIDHQQFVVLASLKANRKAFLESDVRQDFHIFPINLGISIETPKFREVIFDQALGVYVVYLPMNNVASSIYAWERAAKIVDRALIAGERSRMLRYFRSLFRPKTPENWWVEEFLSKRLQANPIDVAQEIREMLHPTEKISTLTTLLGPKEDTVLDLVRP